MAVIKVPKPPKRAFNPERPPSDLLKSQIEHLEWAIRHAGQRRPRRKGRKYLRPYKIKTVRTEHEAALRVASLLPQLASASRLPFTTYTLPEMTPAPRRPKRSRRSKRTTKRTTRKTKSTRKAKSARRSRKTSRKARASKRSKGRSR